MAINKFAFIIINMIQRVIVLFFIYILIFFSFCGFNHKAIAEDIIPVAQKQTTLKVNSINFDNSDYIIFLGTSGVENNSEIKITKQALTEPDRIFFDIENAVITFPNSTYEIKNSRLKQVRIAQNSIEPNIVRIVICSYCILSAFVTL